jgi:hypothetical protein
VFGVLEESCAAWQLQCASSALRISVLTSVVLLLLCCVSCVRSQAWATGENRYGRLGLGDTTDRSTPAQLSSPTNVVQVAAGSSDFGGHTMLLAHV